MKQQPEVTLTADAHGKVESRVAFEKSVTMTVGGYVYEFESVEQHNRYTELDWKAQEAKRAAKKALPVPKVYPSGLVSFYICNVTITDDYHKRCNGMTGDLLVTEVGTDKSIIHGIFEPHAGGSAEVLNPRFTQTLPDSKDEVFSLKGEWQIRFRGRILTPTWPEAGPAQAALRLLQKGAGTVTASGGIKWTHQEPAPK